MRECNCIVIDDKKDFTSSATMNNFLQRAANNNKLAIKLIHLNPKDEKFVNDEGIILLDKVITALDTPQYLKQSIQLIICDYDFASDTTNGFEVVRILRNQLKSKKKIILYSSNIDDVIDKIIKNGDPEKIRNSIIDLVASQIAAFCQRNGHLEEEMIKHLSEEVEFSSDKFFESEFYKYKDYKFTAPYDKFNGKTMGEVAEYISKMTHEGERLKKEMIQQVVAYMIDLKE